MSTGFPLPAIGDIIHQKYQVTKRIGAGSFGAIFEIQSLEDGKLYCVKLENAKSTSPQLHLEHKMYMLLAAGPGFSRVYDYWTEDDVYRAMVMDKLSYSLGHHFRQCGKVLSPKTVVMCAIQMICRLEYVHQRSFVHRDIKPDNFMFGHGTESNQLYIIDFGLAQTYRDLHTFLHKNYTEDQGLAGTARYVSINVHFGVCQSCRDDLESVGYVLVSLVKGSLPWQGLEKATGDKQDPLSQCKLETTPDALCEGLPQEFLMYVQRVRQLRFDERPNYAQLRGLFITLMVKQNMAFDYEYDWVLARQTRLGNALKGDPGASKVLIPTQEDDLLNAIHADPSKVAKNSFLQPLPFFAVMNAACRFVALGRVGMVGAGAAVGSSTGVVLPALRDAMLLDPRSAPLPPAYAGDFTCS